jgi:hypothetical protein
MKRSFMSSRQVVERIEARIADMPRRFPPKLNDASVTLTKLPSSIV